MRVRTMSFRKCVVGVSSGVLIAGLIAGGCGGTTETTGTPVVDAGNQDVTVDVNVVVADTGPAVVDAGPPGCAVDADLTNIQVADASLGDGASSIGVCAACAETTCKTSLDACNDDCDCKAGLVDFFNCYSGGGSLLQCALPLQALGQDAMALGACVYSQCSTACAVGSIVPPKNDAGAPDTGTDSPSDAPNDG